MGVSMERARCHDHPREKWKRTDFLGLAGFFPQVTVKTSTRINEYIVYLDPAKEVPSSRRWPSRWSPRSSPAKSSH